MFLVACAAALMLRDARWWTRLYTWLSVLVTGGLIGAADAYHSMGLKLPHRTTAGTIAALPWVLVMLAFSLWLSMLRHSRSGATRAGVRPGTVPSDPDATASPTLALAASPTARAALPAPEPEPVNQPSIKNIEGRSAENPPPAEVTAAAGPDEPAPETGTASDTAGPPTARTPGADGTDAGAGDGDDEVLGDQPDQPPSPAGPHPSDADTPPYGFPAVTGQDVAAAQNGSRPTATAHRHRPGRPRRGRARGQDADPAVGPGPRQRRRSPGASGRRSEPAPPRPSQKPNRSQRPKPEPASEPEDVAAKGRPPAASPELSGAEAELAHEEPPAEDPPAVAEKKPPTPFERVRSTPTRPAAPEEDTPEEGGAA